MTHLLPLFGSLLACACSRAAPEAPAQPAAAAVEPAAPEPDAVPVDAALEPASPLPPVVHGAHGEAPLYVVIFTHHFRGMGGYYASATEVRDTALACIDQDLAEYCTLFFDGILARRLGEEDPSLASFIREHHFPIGYHGEEAHGPYPIVVSVEALGRRDTQLPQVTQPGWTFAQTVDAIRQRYTHAFVSPQWGSDGYLRRGTGGESDLSRTGGIALVEEWLGVEPQYTPAHALFEPAELFALDASAPGLVLQGAGPFAPHFLRNTRDPELIQDSNAFLGEDTTLFWYMGHLVQKGQVGAEVPMWSDEGFAPRASSGGGRPGARGGRPARDDAQGPPPFRRGGGRGDFSDKPARGNGGAGRFGEGPPGDAVKAAFAKQERSSPRVVQLKIDGSRDSASDFLAWVRQQTARDPSIVLVTPEDLESYVAPPSVTLAASDVATAVLDGWGYSLPDALSVDGQALSHADAFEIMARHLAGAGEVITTTGVNGPLGDPAELHTASGTVRAQDVVTAAAGVLSAIDSSPWRAMPTTVQVGDSTVGFHQYYSLMATVIRDGLADGSASTELPLPQVHFAPAYARSLAGRLHPDLPNQLFWMQAQFWTAKPVTWRE